MRTVVATSSLFVFLWNRGPGFVRAESLHVLELAEGFRPCTTLADSVERRRKPDSYECAAFCGREGFGSERAEFQALAPPADGSRHCYGIITLINLDFWEQ